MATKNGTTLPPPKGMPGRADAAEPEPQNQKKPKESDERQRFWNAFKTCLEENRIPPDRSSHYVRWVREFVDFLPGKRLKARSAEDIRSFLDSLQQREAIADWQVRQAEHALRILYEIFLPRYSSQISNPGNSSGKLPVQKVEAREAFRDRVLPGEVERRYLTLVERFRTEMRTRHYSYRTETSYLEWIRRFIAFHDYADPEILEPSVAIKAYLEYLALKREVSASTQNQALNALVFLYGQIIKKNIGQIGEFERAKRPQRLPEVLTRDEVEALLARMDGVTGLMAGLM